MKTNILQLDVGDVFRKKSSFDFPWSIGIVVFNYNNIVYVLTINKGDKYYNKYSYDLYSNQYDKERFFDLEKLEPIELFGEVDISLIDKNIINVFFRKDLKFIGKKLEKSIKLRKEQKNVNIKEMIGVLE